jgi:hypothetical protein
MQWEYRNCSSLAKAVCFGTASIGLFFVVLTFSPFVGTGDMEHAKQDASSGTAPSVLIREATAAVPAILSNSNPALVTIPGADFRLENYQLERDSCCIGN